MCDLIDLKSPDGKKIHGAKLASPLIPIPQTSAEKIGDSLSSGKTAELFVEKRNSLDNNPFDNVHHKTVEYVRKQEDPFEAVLQKALTFEQQRKEENVTPKSRIADFKDDFTPKKRKYSDILKMNKTLDYSTTNLQINKISEGKTTLSDIPEIINGKSEKIEVSNKEKDRLQYVREIPSLYVESPGLETSILNQSAMNDSLTESSGSADENLLKSIVNCKLNERLRCSSKDLDFLIVGDEIPKLYHLRRSLSQGDKTSPKKFRQQRCHSIMEGLKVGEKNENTSSNSAVPSIIFDDSINKAFLDSSVHYTSPFSDLSNISSITRITPASSAFNSSSSSSMFSNRTANCAFIDSYPSSRSLGEESSKERDLDQLILEYSKLKTWSSGSSMIETSSLTNSITESSNSSQKESSSGTSTDSVFADSDTIEKSIFSEAKTLAKTFEELASKTESTVSSDDLVNSRPDWNFDMLPPSDEDLQVDDLIELKKSPGKSEIEKLEDRGKQEKSGSSSESKSEDKDMLKDLDTNFRDPDNKIIASSLLLDLEKLVKSESNSEAAKLLKSLEKALGVKCESNVDLLATCLGSERNNLEKSPKKWENVGGTENIKDENIEKSREENNEIETSESFKQLSLSENNNLNFDKAINKSDKSPILISDNHDSFSEEREEQSVPENTSGNSIEAIKQQNQITDDQKMAVEILVGLGKLLTGQNKDPQTMNLLKNLGTALNLASSHNSDLDVREQSTNNENKRVTTPVKNRIGTPPRKSTPNSVFSRSVNRRSFDSNSKEKTMGERTMRRSISVTQTPTSTTPNIPRLANAPLTADKSKAHLKDARKRFPSDPSPNVSSINTRKLVKDAPLKSVAISELARQDKPSSTVVAKVKNRFRKKPDSEVASKKGPMKAIIPFGNMQRRGSLAKRESPTAGSTTPPKPVRETSSNFGVTTSTPFAIPHFTLPAKKSPKSKPMAASTPDDVASKHLRRSTSQIPQSPGKNQLFCNISPVTPKTSPTGEDNAAHNNSSGSRACRIGTPSKSRQSSQLPRLSPMLGAKATSPKSNRGQRRSEPLQSFLPKGLTTPKSPRAGHAGDGATSPLNTSNKSGSAVKPFNLISKLSRRRGSVAEKENYAQ
ncbi:uncharacterized protein [Venturia canescens]|uniref:uncharacterized protein isoform X2 n=1 Tax=Venturia canescens TaxID=32260 RepID=UPI001C9D3E32|nr:uncharacterized protein LOC122413973 isoform X2 [Venturia canescens]